MDLGDVLRASHHCGHLVQTKNIDIEGIRSKLPTLIFYRKLSFIAIVLYGPGLRSRSIITEQSHTKGWFAGDQLQRGKINCDGIIGCQH